MKTALCHICGKPARYTCSLCGRPVCENDYDPGTGMCKMHKTGRKV